MALVSRRFAFWVLFGCLGCEHMEFGVGAKFHIQGRRLLFLERVGVDTTVCCEAIGVD